MIKQLITATALVGMMSHAYAMPEIAGEIKFGAAIGAEAFVDIAGEKIDFSPNSDNAVVTIGSGIFAGEQGEKATLFDIDANILGSKLWQTPNFTMFVESFDFEVEQDDSRITIFGDGSSIFTQAGEELSYDGQWTLSLDSSNGGASFSFSSTAIATVAEPGSVALLGLGMWAQQLLSRDSAQPARQ